MEFVKEKWTKSDIKEFNNYLESIKRIDKIDFEKRTCNTSMDVLGINLPTCKEIAKQIQKGNYLDFL